MTDKECTEFLRSIVFREYEKRIEDHFKSTDARATSDRQAWEREFKSLEQALKLQAAEYERRLAALNHAHDNAIKEQARVMSREMHEAFVKENNIWRDGVNVILNRTPSLAERITDSALRLDTLTKDYETFKITVVKELSVISTRSITWLTAIGLLITLVSIAIKFVKL